MASLVNYMVIVASIQHFVYGGDYECINPLGMANGKIADRQITASHWLYYQKKLQDAHYKPFLARLNFYSVSGGWCSEDNVEYPNQYIQIDLLKNTKLRCIATQGREGTDEYTQAYQVTYQRNKETKFRKYRENGRWKKFVASNKSTVTNCFKHPIIARTIRIYPRGDEFSIFCMRLELYGCKWDHGSSDIASYTAPLGALFNGINTKDFEAYDGAISTRHNLIKDGLGKLTDDIYGKRSIASAKTSPWVAYSMKNPKITFKFHKKRLVRKVMIHVLNDGKQINIFQRAIIRMGTQDGNFTTITEYSSNFKQLNKVGTMAIWIDLGEILTQHIQIEFVKSSRWLLVSEILFISDDFPPKRLVPAPTVNDVAMTVVYQSGPDSDGDDKNEKDMIRNHVSNKMGDATKGLSFPIILTITLVTSALFIVLTIVIYKTYVKKKTDHAIDSRDHAPSPQIPVIDKQAVSLLYADEQRMKFHPNTLIQHGMYIQSYNPHGISS